jgi:hypothetical protein
LDNQNGAATANSEGEPQKPTWIFRAVSYFERKYQERRAKKKQESPQKTGRLD